MLRRVGQGRVWYVIKGLGGVGRGWAGQDWAGQSKRAGQRRDSRAEQPGKVRGILPSRNPPEKVGVLRQCVFRYLLSAFMLMQAVKAKVSTSWGACVAAKLSADSNLLRELRTC